MSAERQYANMVPGKTVRYVEETDRYLYMVFEDGSSFRWEYSWVPSDTWGGRINCDRTYKEDKNEP